MIPVLTMSVNDDNPGLCDSTFKDGKKFGTSEDIN